MFIHNKYLGVVQVGELHHEVTLRDLVDHDTITHDHVIQRHVEVLHILEDLGGVLRRSQVGQSEVQLLMVDVHLNAKVIRLEVRGCAQPVQLIEA